MTTMTEEFRKNENDERFIERFNAALVDIEKEYISAQEQSNQPVLFICGAPRSGITLLTQVFARSGLFNYITNFTARFWRVPFVGFYLEKLIGLRNLVGISGHTFKSSLGRTDGILDPHDFTYFWKYWLKYDGKHDIFPESKFKEIDVKGVRKEINAMVNFYEKPIFFRNILIYANPWLLHKIFPSSYFVVMRRDTLSNALAILEARRLYFGDENGWLSVRPRNYEELKNQPVEVQIIGQIKGIHDEIIKQTKDFTEGIINITYEELCNNPYDTTLKVAEHIGIKNFDIEEVRHKLPKSFVIQNLPYSSETIKKFEEVL